MKNLFKKIILAILPIIASAQIAFATPLPALFYASSFTVNVGDTLTFDLKMNPAAASPVYTVGATLKYDPSILSFSDASIDKAWLPLARAPYEVTDTSSGIITRTAGYPEGLKSVAPFTHYVFKATTPGDTKVVISQGMALDADNNDSGLQVKTIAIHVNGSAEKAPASETPAPTSKTVPQTITLDVTGNTAFYSDEAYNFSIAHALKVAQTTTGTTSFSVFDQNGAEVYSSSEVFNTATDTSITFQIPASTIAPGDYTIVATSKYSDQKTPSTVKKDIGVLARGEKVVEKNVEIETIPLWIWIAVGVLILLLILMLLYNNNKKFRKFVKNF